MEMLTTSNYCGQLGLHTIEQRAIEHNTKLYNSPLSRSQNSYVWDMPIKKDITVSNRSRIYQLSLEQKAIQTMQLVNESKPYLSPEQRQHLTRVYYINEKELDYRRKIDRS